jgi:Domain of unknown function (DUF6458)
MRAATSPVGAAKWRMPADSQGGDKVGIGGSIFLLAVGAILAFAVDVHLGWLNLSTVGWVLMIAGVVGLIMTAYLWNSRRRTVVVDDSVPSPRVPVDERVVEERQEVRRPPL